MAKVNIVIPHELLNDDCKCLWFITTDWATVLKSVTVHKRVSLLLAGAGSLQCHRSQSLSSFVWTVCWRGGLSGPLYLVTFQRHQTQFWLVCPPVAENCPQYLQRHHQFRVWGLHTYEIHHPFTSMHFSHITFIKIQKWPLFFICIGFFFLFCDVLWSNMQVNLSKQCSQWESLSSSTFCAFHFAQI